MTNTFQRVLSIATLSLSFAAAAQQPGVWTATPENGGTGSSETPSNDTRRDPYGLTRPDPRNRDFCKVNYPGGTKTFSLQPHQWFKDVDGGNIDPRANVPVRACYELQKAEIRKFCSLLQSGEYNRYLRDIEVSGGGLDDLIAIKPAWNTQTPFAFSRNKKDIDFFNDFMRLHDMPSGEGEHLFNVAFGNIRKLEVIAGTLHKSIRPNAQAHCINARTKQACYCAKADGLLAFVKMYANSYTVRKALADSHKGPPFTGTHGEVGGVNSTAGNADARYQPGPGRIILQDERGHGGNN